MCGVGRCAGEVDGCRSWRIVILARSATGRQEDKRAIFQAAAANLNPFSETKVGFKAENRGPILIISGEKDHTVPHAIAHAAYKKHSKNQAVTEFVELPDRGHSLTIDHGWQEVAQTALDFIRKNGPATA